MDVLQSGSVSDLASSCLERVRGICLGFPGVSEQTGGTPVLDDHARLAAVFRVNRRSFVWFLDNHHGDGRISVTCKAGPGRADALVALDPVRFFQPPYLKRAGWVGLRLDGEVNWDEVIELVEDSYRVVASRKLLAELDGRR